MAPPQRQKKRKQEYEESPDWGTVFQRADNKPPRPGFTGVGVLSEDTLNEIVQADGQFQISIWTLNRDGEPLRNRDGSRRFRVHIEPPYEGDGETNSDDGPNEDRDTRNNGNEPLPF